MLFAAAHQCLRTAAAATAAAAAGGASARAAALLSSNPIAHQQPLLLQPLLRGYAGDAGDRGQGTAVAEPGASAAPRPSGGADGRAPVQRQDVKFDPRDGTSFSRNEMPSRTSGEFDDDGYWGGGGGEPTTDTARIRQEIESPANSYTSGFLAGMHRPGHMVVRELDEQGREVGAVGLDPDAPQGFIWHQQTVEGAMAADNPGPPSPDAGATTSRSQPGGTPVAGGLDPLRPDGPASGRSMSADPGAFARQRLGEMAAEAWETLKHGVNNAGQPQVIEELKRVTPETGPDSAVLNQPRSTASRPDEATAQLIKEMAERK
ncbi:hypothetical protein HYH02_003015 [Chlamydomonas schloesseri]|uniref:Uncharacterized protein n=1 Tax=Chlamydomonas schloesseri TaxID=2026947 RepID=A0A835WSB8_9CHLO|nr:hypothetical protein HYH02_003015 [Chlamydomonas schloesseri]|eukprot:KAG2452785.1 hypothetical protein HYH02_003015 [Chlamydomonas schloesseri]